MGLLKRRNRLLGRLGVHAKADLAPVNVDQRNQELSDLNHISDGQFEVVLLHKIPPCVTVVTKNGQRAANQRTDRQSPQVGFRRGLRLT